jgi:hypothetical protein
MAVTTASLRSKLRSFAAALQPWRLAFSTSRPCSKNFDRTLIPDNCAHFLQPSGQLYTTAENVDFLKRYDLGYDTAKMAFLPHYAETRTLFKELGVWMLFSRQHVLSTRDLRYLDPRGHPLAYANLARLAHEAQTQPLWIMTTCVQGPKAVVRISAQRALRSNIWQALEAQGYDKYGRSSGRKPDLRGTLWINIREALETVTHSKGRFGELIVRQLEMQCGPSQQQSAERKQRRPGQGPPGKPSTPNRTFRPKG